MSHTRLDNITKLADEFSLSSLLLIETLTDGSYLILSKILLYFLFLLFILMLVSLSTSPLCLLLLLLNHQRVKLFNLIRSHLSLLQTSEECLQLLRLQSGHQILQLFLLPPLVFKQLLLNPLWECADSLFVIRGKHG